MITDAELLKLMANKKPNKLTAASFTPKGPTPKPFVNHKAFTPRKKKNNSSTWLTLLVSLLCLAGLSTYRGHLSKPIAATGSQLSDGINQEERVDIQVAFIKPKGAKNGQVKWKVETSDGYPLTVILAQGMQLPKLPYNGQKLRIIGQSLGPGALTIKRSEDIQYLANLDSTTYHGTFEVKDQLGYAHLADGTSFSFRADGYPDNTYNTLELGQDEKGKGIALSLKAS